MHNDWLLEGAAMKFLIPVAACLGSLSSAVSGASAEIVAPSPSLPDGPYVLWGTNNKWVVKTKMDRDRPVEIGDTIVIQAVGKVPAFDVKLRSPLSDPLPEALKLGEKLPMFVMPDTHGEYGIMIELLQAQKIVDDKLNWSFGRGHMVVVGDIFDRGEHQLPILWLLYKLEEEARMAGGGLHVVLGNHENMVLRDDLRYLHPRHADTAKVLGYASYAQLFDSKSLLGNWLRSKPSLLRIDDMLFAHGGVSPDLAAGGMSLERVNYHARRLLELKMTPEQFQLEGEEWLVLGNKGPLWYRGYFAQPAKPHYGPVLTEQQVTDALATFGGKRIFVGHTPLPYAQLLYNGKIAAIQVYPTRDQSGRPVMEAALRLNGKWQVADAQGRRKPFHIVSIGDVPPLN